MTMKSWYKPTAAETEEGKKRLGEYHSALGRFVDRFSQVEMAVAFTLWHYAKTPYPIARAAFSGTNLDAAISSIKRLFEVTEIPEKAQEEITWLFDQLSKIRKARNDILHYGAINVPEGDAAVTNAAKALTRDRIEHFPISPAILDNMSADLKKILVRLHLNHLGRPKISPASLKMFDEALQNTWRYKHQPQRLKRKTTEESPQPHTRAPKPSPPEQSSQE
ncbi:hypothetical protein [Methylocapsa sp. S129]|uniref:hypothetical protein n=1 Tax=Methylocapsa sp. S129 TaxID=1641869 RepID=UPI00131EBC47|nr:hypothetical protein [Methylocapsa sp. S129]